MRRRFEASQDRLWAACTDLNQLRRWFAKVTGDMREGATMTFDVGAPNKITSCILRCRPPQNLALTWSYPGRNVDEVEFCSKAHGDGTIVEIVHRSYDKTDWWLGAGAGWEYALIKLSALLKGDDPSEISAEEIDARLAPLWREAGGA